MSGCGRKHRAKHLTQQYLDDDSWSGPKGKEEIAISTESPHGRHLHVYKVPNPTASEGSITPSSSEALIPSVVYLPGKFSKVIWISVKDVLVIADQAVERKLSPAQLTIFYDANPLWKEAIQRVIAAIATQRNTGEEKEAVEAVYENDDDLGMFENPNRKSIKHRQAMFLEEEGDEEVEEVEGDEEEEDEEEEVSGGEATTN